MTQEATSGKRVVGILLAIVLLVALVAWLAATQLERRRASGPAPELAETTKVLDQGVLFEAQSGDAALLVAKDVASGKELWRAELGSVTAEPILVVHDEVVEVQIAGTSWMTLDRNTGEPVE